MQSVAPEVVCAAKSTPALQMRITSSRWFLEYRRKKSVNLCVKMRLTATSTHGKYSLLTIATATHCNTVAENNPISSSRYDSSEALANLCVLLSDCTDQVTECTGCFSGPPSCSTETVTDDVNGK